MDIWIIRNGEKAGPIHDYEIRHRIEAGDLGPTTQAWHEGLDGWRPLVDIDLFHNEFKTAPELDSQPENLETSAPASAPPPLPVKHTLVRRFWARWFDLQVYGGLWWFAMWAAGQDIEAVLNSGSLMFLQLLPWFILETILLQRYGTTPGKWLLGLRVANNDGSLLDLTAATKRSLRVLIVGIGFGYGLLSLFCQLLSFFTARKIGSTLWDYTGGHRVESRPLVPWKIAVLVILFFAAGQLRSIVVTRYEYPAIIEKIAPTFPGFAEEIEKNPPWTLPDRSRK